LAVERPDFMLKRKRHDAHAPIPEDNWLDRGLKAFWPTFADDWALPGDA
jgi:hypothetical protein